jgi:SGNH hydrolase-like domain, acetyltransferase AlgX
MTPWRELQSFFSIILTILEAQASTYWPSWWLVLSLLAGGLAIYCVLGHRFIDAVYKSDLWINAILSGRVTTPVEFYYMRADDLVLRASVWVLFGYAAASAVLRQPASTLLLGASLVFTSLLLFWLFETFPALIKTFGLHNIFTYYAYTATYLPDPELGFRGKPFNRSVTHDFAGAQYTAVFAIDVPRMTLEWIMDRDGFRNARETDTADIVLLGDSYLEYGVNQDDTFGAKLERHLPGITVRNLGKSGYSPFQYLIALRRYGLKYKPRYAVMAMYEGNDISDIRRYLLWKSGDAGKGGSFLYRFATYSLLRRYRAAAAATLADVRQAFRASRTCFLYTVAKNGGYAPTIHPEVAHLNVHGTVHRKLFIDRFTGRSTTELLATEELSALKNILTQFNELCNANGITPIILYIPAAVQIYAKYSTQASGASWLKQLKTQLAVSHDIETAIGALVREAEIDFVSLTPAFERAAEEGKLLYYPLDAHWNSEGSEIAARCVAQMFQSKYLHSEVAKPS